MGDHRHSKGLNILLILIFLFALVMSYMSYQGLFAVIKSIIN